MTIIDRRKLDKNKSLENRKKFIDRYHRRIKEKVDALGKDGSIKNIDKDKKIILDTNEIDEHSFQYDPEKGVWDFVSSGNKKFKKGDKITKPKGMKGGRGSDGSDSSETEDAFQFVLTKEEFLYIYFKDMALPNFVKERLAKTDKSVLVRAGYSKEGIPPKLCLKKTFKQSIARRLSQKASIQEQIDEADKLLQEADNHNKIMAIMKRKEKLLGRKIPFLDEYDLRYKYFKKQPKPIRQAVVFFIMDVSASMTEDYKDLSKRFFLLFYLFLEKEYKNVEVVFIRYTEEAQEVDEHDFFYNRRSGGTISSTAIRLTDQIISERYNPTEYNIYVAHASDGDNWPEDNNAFITSVRDSLIHKLQYYAYIQISDSEREKANEAILAQAPNIDTLFGLLQTIKDVRINIRKVFDRADIYPVLHELFKKQ